MDENKRKKFLKAGFSFIENEKYGEMLKRGDVVMPISAIGDMSVESVILAFDSVFDDRDSNSPLVIDEEGIRNSILEGRKLLDKLDENHFISVSMAGQTMDYKIEAEMIKVSGTITTQEEAVEVLYSTPLYSTNDKMELIRLVGIGEDEKSLLIRSWPLLKDINQQSFGCAYLRLLDEAYRDTGYDNVLLVLPDEDNKSVIGICVYNKDMPSIEESITSIREIVKELAPRINAKRIHCIGYTEDENGDGKPSIYTIDRTPKTIVQDLVDNRPEGSSLFLVSKTADGDYYIISSLSVGLQCTSSEIEKLQYICEPIKAELGPGNKVIVVNTGLNFDYHDEIDLYQ